MSVLELAGSVGARAAGPWLTRRLARPASLLLMGLMPWLGPAGEAVAQCASAAGASAVAPELPLFAVEIKVGPRWDAARPPQDQAFFREHSAHLRRLREAGVLVMGARYADKGLVVVAAASIADVQAQMDQDPSMAAGTFTYEVHPFNVFYSGEVKARSRR